MKTSKKNYPETKEELIKECYALIDRYDLYTLGEPRETGDRDYYPDGTENLSGEYLYGVAMIPCQWVTNILETNEGTQ
jgi:hypothetical protein